MRYGDIDSRLIQFFQKIYVPMARFGLFVIFFWFGILKVVGQSPASPLVAELFAKTIGWMSFDTFIVLFGLFEMLIGVLFIVRGAERIALVLLFFHMITTFMPLFLLPDVAWTATLVPTLEGQYMIKNLVIIASALSVGANLRPLKS